MLCAALFVRFEFACLLANMLASTVGAYAIYQAPQALQCIPCHAGEEVFQRMVVVRMEDDHYY